jgi:diacylglycerol kinase family enzyme
MYFYIYDSFLKERRYERELAIVESRLTDLGLNGKVGRLTPFTNARGLIRDETRRGVETIVAVGDDETVAKVIGGLGDASITLGIIPIGGSTVISESLGVPPGFDACEVLSRRVAKRLDLGSANGHFFLSEVRVSGKDVVVETDQGFRLSGLVPETEVVICNMRSPEMEERGLSSQLGDPLDGYLDLMIFTRERGLFGRVIGEEGFTALRIKSVNITASEQFHAMVDGREFSTEALSVQVVPDRVRVITGRDRVFEEEADLDNG